MEVANKANARTVDPSIVGAGGADGAVGGSFWGSSHVPLCLFVFLKYGFGVLSTILNAPYPLWMEIGQRFPGVSGMLHFPKKALSNPIILSSVVWQSLPMGVDGIEYLFGSLMLGLQTTRTAQNSWPDMTTISIPGMSACKRTWYWFVYISSEFREFCKICITGIFVKEKVLEMSAVDGHRSLRKARPIHPPLPTLLQSCMQ